MKEESRHSSPQSLQNNEGQAPVSLLIISTAGKCSSSAPVEDPLQGEINLTA